MANIVKVPFYGDEIEAVQDERGVWASIRRLAENFSLDPEGQRQKIERAPWAVACKLKATGSDGKIYEQSFVHVESIPGWLFTINAAKLADEALRGKLVAYQKECARVLRDHFFGRAPAAIDVAAIVPAIVAAVQTGIASAITALRAEDEHRRERDSMVGASGHRAVRATLTDAARKIAGETKGKRYRGIRQGLDNDLRAGLGWSGAGRTWAAFPASRWADLRVRLDEIRRAADRASPAPQLSIVDGGR